MLTKFFYYFGFKTEVTNEYIWTYEFGDNAKPKIVLLHGFSGSGMAFYRMFPYLKSNFHVYLIDMMGSARSSRHKFKLNNYEQCEVYFINGIEKWRQKVGIEKMNLIGHSLGGFIASKYALNYPQNLDKLLLISPWGGEPVSKEAEEQKLNKIYEKSIVTKYSYKTFRKLYDMNLTPFFFLRIFGRLSSIYIGNWVRKLFKLSEEEHKDLTYYFTQLLLQRGSGEYAFRLMFPRVWFSDHPIMNSLNEYKNIDISFYYGDKDWNDSSFSGNKCSETLKSLGYKVSMIPEGGHHIYMDNPKATTELIVEDFKRSKII